MIKVTTDIIQYEQAIQTHTSIEMKLCIFHYFYTCIYKKTLINIT